MPEMLGILRQFFNEHDLAQQGLSTLLLLIALLLLRSLLRRWVTRADIAAPDIRRRWVVAIRNFTLALFVVGMIIIWATQLRTLAVSLVAFAAVVVLSLKEVIMCVTGSLLKAASRSARSGARSSTRRS